MAFPCYGCKRPATDQPPANKILVAVQYYRGDMALAEQVLRLMADLEPGHSNCADLLLAWRIDCPPPSSSLVNHLRHKFDVLNWQGRRWAQGWPNGPNECWMDLMSRVHGMTVAKKWNYKAVLTTEADATPLTRDWISTLLREWDAAVAARRVHIMGDLQLAPREHINGNALFSCDLKFLKFICDIGSCSPTEGWDYHLAGQFKRWNWLDTSQMRSDWQCPHAGDGFLDQLLQAGVVFHHGVKDGSLIAQVRKKLL